MARRRRSRAHAWLKWERWFRGLGALYYVLDNRDDFEVPFAHIRMPHELWATIVHFSIDKSPRTTYGVPPSVRGDNIDRGALVVALHDTCDMEAIFHAGISADPWSGTPNRATKELLDALSCMPLHPGLGDYESLGARVDEMAERMDLGELFAQ